MNDPSRLPVSYLWGVTLTGMMRASARRHRIKQRVLFRPLQFAITADEIVRRTVVLIPAVGERDAADVHKQVAERDAFLGGRRRGILVDWFGHRLIHHFLAEEGRAKQFITTTELFVHLSRQLVMGGGVGMKRHCDDDVFSWSFHVVPDREFNR